MKPKRSAAARAFERLRWIQTALRGGVRDTATLAELADRYQWRIHHAHASHRIDWTDMTYADGSPVEFTGDHPAEVAATAVLEVPLGRAAGHDGWPLANGSVLISDATFVAEKTQFREYERLGRAASQRWLRGTAALLTSTFSSGNYGHALLDSLGRLAILEKAGIDVSTLDFVIAPSFRAPTLDRILRDSGVAEERIIRLGVGEHAVADLLYVTSFPGAPRCYPNWLAPWMRDRIGSSELPPRRLYLGREGGHRQLENAREIAAVLERFGFESYDPTAVGASADDFAAAGAVAGPHGAAMSDIVFCAPGTPVIEIVPSGHRHPYFASLAVSSGLRYVAVRGTSVSDERNANFTVDPDEFDAALRAALNE